VVGTVAGGEPGPRTADLRGLLGRTIPPYMIPAAFGFVGALPRKPNGKLDRAALPSPDWEAGDSDAFAPPRGPEEEAIAAIWCEVLGIQRAGVRDDFFALGGQSLLAVLVTSRIRAQLDVDVGIASFFEQPTIEALAATVIKKRAAGTAGATIAPIAQVARDGELPLSFAQHRMWFLHRLAPTSPA